MAGRQRPRMQDFKVGDQVYYWRDDRQPGSTSRWHGPGMIIGRIENTQKIYICVGSRVYRCAPEHVRFANEEEKQVISTLLPELEQLGELITENKGPAVIVDLSEQEGAPDNQFQDGDETPKENDDSDDEDKKRAHPEGTGETGKEGGIENDPLHDPFDVEDASSKRKKMTKQELIDTLMNKLEGTDAEPGKGLSARMNAFEEMQEGLRVGKRTERKDAKEKTKEKSHEKNKESRAATLVQTRADRLEAEFARRREEPSSSSTGTSSSTSNTSSSRPGSAKSDKEKKEEAEAHKFFDDMAKELEQGKDDKDDSDVLHGDALIEYDVYIAEVQAKGRKEITEKNMDPIQRAKFITAKISEWKKMLDSDALEIFGPEKARVLRRRIPQGRVIKSRFVLTKGDMEEDGYSKAKARWCLKGFLDPDLLSLEKCSPTITKEGMNLILECIAMNKWGLNVMDVEGAFLQGEILERPNG